LVGDRAYVRAIAEGALGWQSVSPKPPEAGLRPLTWQGELAEGDSQMNVEVGSGPVVGVDIGGTGIKGAPVDIAAGRFAAERVRLPTPSPATPQAVADVVGELLRMIGVEGPVGITLPAVVRAGTVETAAHLDQSWIGIDAVELFSEATGRRVAVMNDADAAGIAEFRFGAGRGKGGVIAVLTLGTGIGSALLADGTLVRNTELGHLPLHHGDAEDWAAESVREHDGLSWKKYAHRLQAYLELVQRLLWPELIIIGGGISKKADKFLPRIELRTPIVPAQLRNDAGVIGAALLASPACDHLASEPTPRPTMERQP
jgi:polyphosphate glucokinase